MLEIKGEHIAALGDEDLRALVIQLVEAEIRRRDLPWSSILGGGNQTAPDGGIDVRVRLPADGGELDFIPRPSSGFQVKCEDMPPAKITKEMRPGGPLRQSIKDLITERGAYVIVSSKGTVADAALANRLAEMRKAVSDEPGAEWLMVDFYDRDRLARWVRQYAGVEMWLRDRVGARLQGWQPYGPWAGVKASEAYLHDDSARLLERTAGRSARAVSVVEGIDQLREKVGKPGQVARLVGLSGTGKTRLAQALFEAGVGSSAPLDQALVIYTDLGNAPEPNAREMLLSLGAGEQRAIVVVDNCNPETHRALAAVVHRYPGCLSLLTVEYDVADDDVPEATDVFELEPASSQVLGQILERYAPHLNAPDASRIVDFSGGNPRIAIYLARTVTTGESLGTLTDGDLFRRLFRQGQADDPALMKAAEACSLVYSFDGEDIKSDASELRVLAGLIGVSAPELFRHVATLKSRDLVQSRSTWRALLPPALANRLAKAALKSISPGDILDAFGPNQRLLISFSRRLEYLHDSEEARAIASRWLADENWLANPAALNDLGRKLFFNLAPLVPDEVLDAIERAMSPATIADFASRQKGSLRSWSALVRHLAFEPAAFDRAAALLLALADIEGSDVIDCQIAWKELFRAALSGTKAPPDQRARHLERLLASETGRRLELTWEAVKATLDVFQVNSSHDFSFGARPHGYGWEAQNDKDAQVWFDHAFKLVTQIATSSAAGRDWAKNAVAEHFRELWSCGAQSQLVALAHDFAAHEGWPAGWVAVKSALRFDGKHMPPDLLKALRELGASLAPKGLLQDIRTYALGHASGFLDVADHLDESDEEEEQNPIDAWQRVEAKVLELGQTLAHHEELLRQVLPELFAAREGRHIALGRGLGTAAVDPSPVWDLLREAFLNSPASPPNIGILSGFFAGLKSRDAKASMALLATVVGHERLDPLLPTLMGAPTDDSEGDELIAAMQRPGAVAHRFTLRVARPDADGLSLGKFCEAVEELSRLDRGLTSAFDELCSELFARRGRSGPMPPELVHLGRSLLAKFNWDVGDYRVVGQINEVARMALVGPEAAEAASALATRFAAALDDYRTHSDSYGQLAITVFKLQPRAALDAFLAEPRKHRPFGFRSKFLARNGPIIQSAPEEIILDWVRVDPDARAPVIAAEINIVSVDAAAGLRLSPLAERLLELSTEKKPVLEALANQLHPNGWSGSLADTLAPFLALLEGLTRRTESEIADWAHEHLAKVRARIEKEKTFRRAQEQSFESFE